MPEPWIEENLYGWFSLADPFYRCSTTTVEKGLHIDSPFAEDIVALSSRRPLNTFSLDDRNYAVQHWHHEFFRRAAWPEDSICRFWSMIPAQNARVGLNSSHSSLSWLLRNGIARGGDSFLSAVTVE